MFHGMKIYTVHVQPDRFKAKEQPIFLREGFNWMAFLFTFLWAFYNRMWLVGFVVLGVSLVVQAVATSVGLSELSVTAMQFGIQILVGMQGNDWLRAKLAKQGYILADISSGDSLLSAQQRYFERYVAAA
jgi:bacteriorhodopsin